MPLGAPARQHAAENCGPGEFSDPGELRLAFASSETATFGRCASRASSADRAPGEPGTSVRQLGDRRALATSVTSRLRSAVFRVRLVIVAGGIGAILVCCPHPAQATFPGRDGMIAYTRQTGSTDCPEGSRCRPFQTSIGVVAPSGFGGRRLAVCRARSECLPGSPAWSPAGTRLALSYFFDVRVAQGNGRRARRVAGAGGGPAWSPDGRRLAFARLQFFDGARPPAENLFTVGVDGKQIRRVTRNGGFGADWSARGDLAFVRSERRRPDVYTARPDGSNVRRLTTGGAESPSWSPRGTKLAVTMRLGRRRGVAVIDRRGRVLRVLERRGGTSPVWSPSGRQIAFVRRHSVYVCNANGSGSLRRLLRTDFSAELFGLSWQARRAP